MSGYVDEAAEETAQFAKVIATFKHYHAYSVFLSSFVKRSDGRLTGPYSRQISANNRRLKDFYKLPPNDREALGNLGYKEKLAAVDKAIVTNAEFFNQIVADPHIFGHEIENDPPQDGFFALEVTPQASGSHYTPPSHDYVASQGTYQINNMCPMV